MSLYWYVSPYCQFTECLPSVYRVPATVHPLSPPHNRLVRLCPCFSLDEPPCLPIISWAIVEAREGLNLRTPRLGFPVIHHAGLRRGPCIPCGNRKMTDSIRRGAGPEGFPSAEPGRWRQERWHGPLVTHWQSWALRFCSGEEQASQAGQAVKPDKAP